MQHPNLFFSKNDIERYKNRIKSDPAAKERYKQVISEEKACLEESLVTEEQANHGSSQHADFSLLNHQANRFCDVLGTKYLVEGDEKCAQKLKELLFCFISFERWYSVTYTKRTPVPWHSDLCSTSTTLALGCVYDIIYDYLTPEERQTAARGILEKGIVPAFSDWILPESRIHALDSMGHNWWSVCISEPATALLAIQDEIPDESRRLIALADEALAQYMSYGGNKLFNKLRNFDEQGLFYESTAYNNYGTGTLLRYLWCNERYFGRNELIRNVIPDELCDSLITFSYPVTDNNGIRYDFLNFGDSSVRDNYSLITKYAIRLGIASDSMKACAATYRTDIREEIGGFSLDDIKGSFDKIPKTRVFSSGYAVSRNSYAPDSTVFAVKSGFCWNHSHNDSGTFVIFHKGRPFFIDSGTCSYDSPLYHAYYCQDCSHSVLRIGNQGRRDEELYRGTKFPGSLTDSYEGSDYFFVQADSTGPMAHLCSRMFRNFIWIENRILVIFDDVYCHEENTVDFTVHADAEYKHNGNCVMFDNGTSKARLISHRPEMVYSEKYGHPEHAENEDMLYAELSTADKERTHLLINTIELDPDENPVTFKKLESKNASGISIEEKNCIREIWFNHMADGHIMHDNSNNIIGGFDTDAYMLMITRNRNDDRVRVLMICGSYLRTDNRALVSSFIKITKEITI